MTKREACRIRNNSLVTHLYIQKDGSWGPRKTAKVFSSQNACDKYMTANNLTDCGIF